MEHCDLVMKGGITSGVIYPKLIARLATHYTFKNIGGTSAGAIAAGACAAAEYRRQRLLAKPSGSPAESPAGDPAAGTGADVGIEAFEKLARLPAELNLPITSNGPSKLLSLFQPAEAVRPHFAVLIRALNRRKADAVQAVLTGVLGMYKWLLGIGMLLGGLLLWPFLNALLPAMGPAHTAVLGPCVMLLLTACTAAVCLKVPYRRFVLVLLFVTLVALMIQLLGESRGPVIDLLLLLLGMVVLGLLLQAVLLALVGGLFVRGLLTGVHGNFYGLCSGQTPAHDGGEAPPQGLTDWLTAYFDDLAGLTDADGPLTFGHLWNPTGATPAGERSINLEVMTTAVSQQMVYGIPFRSGSSPFYYDPDEWARLFPQAVMKHLACMREASTASGAGDGAPLQVVSPGGKPLFALPRDGALPVVVAVRMSLSFPVLLSAVPLYAIDWSLKNSQIQRQKGLPIAAKRVWFSDGGIGSNMPLHMFDALLPGHPTFAVNLKPEHPDHPIATPEEPDNKSGRIYLPSDSRGGRQRFWAAPEDGVALGGLMGFVASIVNTMQSWRDEIMFPYPGFRDRIIQISQRPNEGGLNLKMPRDSIEALAKAGEMAADRLIDHFHPQGSQHGEGWRKHQEARLATFLGTLQPGTTALCPVLESAIWRSIVETRLPRYTKIKRRVATEFLAGVQALGGLGVGTGASLDQVAPRPLAQVRISPRI